MKSENLNMPFDGYRASIAEKTISVTLEHDSGKFILKRDKFKEFHTYRFFRGVKVECKEEHTEEDVTEEVLRGSLDVGSERITQSYYSEFNSFGVLLLVLQGAFSLFRSAVFILFQAAKDKMI